MGALSSISPTRLKKLAGESFASLVLAEIGRARRRVSELERAYPSAGRKELERRLIDTKKALASTSGAISGLFGIVSVPLDLVLVTWLQTSLIVDIATLYHVNLKSRRAQAELLDLLSYVNGSGPVLRASPKVVGQLAMALFQRGGLPGLSRAVPVVSAPVTAWLNHRALARAGREAARFYAREGRREQSAGD